MREVRSQVTGEFTGYSAGAVFKLVNGQIWQQRRHKYKYKYKYRPMVRLFEEGGRILMEFDCMDESIEVVRVSAVEDGAITSEFNGFQGDSTFDFGNGRIWKQDEYKYEYHYAYRPTACVIDGIDGPTLFVDGMSETVRVRRV